MAAVANEAPATTGEVKKYRIHVSSRYLDLTRQKLEIARLPHENSEPRSEDWWEPKSRVEPLIDFWLEQYSWRTQEDELNAQLPQYRTAFTTPGTEAPVRIHFIHIRSPHPNAIPLLLIPPFPFTNLSFRHIIKAFVNPEDVATNQPFHLVIPSLPGLGFSDALPNNTAVISTTSEMFNSLMGRLEYPHYLVTNASSGLACPAEIDWKLANYLATQHHDSCLGAHFISPPLARPKFQEAPIEWAKWSIANLFHAPILGYRNEDFAALKRNCPAKTSFQRRRPTPAQFGLNQLGLREPNTLAYALCDSPTGLLVFVLKSLLLLGPKKEFSPTEIINFTQLAWLPGPEAAMRLWAHCVRHPEEIEHRGRKARVGITVFLGDEPEAVEGQGSRVEESRGIMKTDGKFDGYACPSWANARYNVVHAHRAAGKAGLLTWERPEIITDGVRGLAKAVIRLDSRLKHMSATHATVPLEQVTTNDDPGRIAATCDAGPETGVPADPTLQPATPLAVDEDAALEVPFQATSDDSGFLAPIQEERLQPERNISDDTRVASDSEEREKEKAEEDTFVQASPDAVHVDTPLRSA